MAESNPLRDALKILQAAGLHDQGLELAIKHTKNLTVAPAEAVAASPVGLDYVPQSQLLEMTEDDIKQLKASDPAKYRRSLEHLGMDR